MINNLKVMIKNEWFMLLFMILFAPVGIALLFYYHNDKYGNILKITVCILATMVLFSRCTPAKVVEKRVEVDKIQTVNVTKTVTETVTVTPVPTLTEAEKEKKKKEQIENDKIFAEEERVRKVKEEKELKEEKIEEAKRLKAEKAENEKILASGNFTSGKDFKAGTHDIIAIKGNGNVHSSNMFSGGINAMMGIRNSEFYEKEYKNIKLPEGTTLKVFNGVTIKLIFKD